MKNKIKKTIYILAFIVTILLFIYLAIFPIQKEVQLNLYNDTSLVKYKGIAKQNIFCDNNGIFKIMFMLNSEVEYNNLNIKLISSDGDEKFNIFVEKYNSYGMFFEFEELTKNQNYTLIIEDLDGDDIELGTVKGDGKDYLLDNPNNSLQILKFAHENNYMLFWYPLFLFAVLFILYPFVWRKENEKK